MAPLRPPGVIGVVVNVPFDGLMPRNILFSTKLLLKVAVSAFTAVVYAGAVKLAGDCVVRTFPLQGSGTAGGGGWGVG